MRGPWRAALALALHVGFFALLAALALGLLGATALNLRSDLGDGLQTGAVALAVLALVAVALRAILRVRDSPRGTAVEKSTQPQVWKMAEAIASACGTKAPNQLRITSGASVRVRQDTALLGLRGRGYALEIGLPLLAGLTASELHSTVAREVGHLVGRGRLAAITYRTSVAVEHVLTELPGGPTKWLFAGYARLHAALAAPANRALELDCADLAVRIAGKRPAVTAVRKGVAVELGWREYRQQYLRMATDVERTPNVLLGFRSFMDDPERKPAIAERAKQAIAEEAGSDGARLPTARETVEVMKRLSARDRTQDDRPAFALLQNPRKSVPALEDQLLVDGLGPRVQWPELARQAGAADAAHRAGELSAAVAQSSVETEPAIGGVLAALHRGQGQDLINPVLDPSLDPDALDEAVVDTLTRLLAGSVVDSLVLAGHAHHELSWSGPSSILLRNGQPLDPYRLVRPAVEDPRLVPGLHKALVDLGVPLNHARPPSEEPEPKPAGVLSPIRCGGSRYELLVTDRGLLLLPSAHGRLRGALTGALTRLQRAEDQRLAALAATPPEELRRRSDAQWVDSRDIAEGELDRHGKGWSLRLELYLDEYCMSSLDAVAGGLDAAAADSGADGDTTSVRLHGGEGSERWGTPYEGLRELLGARMGSDPGASER